MLSLISEKGFNVGFSLFDQLELEVWVQAINTTMSWFEFFSIAGYLTNYIITLTCFLVHSKTTMYKKARILISK